MDFTTWKPNRLKATGRSLLLCCLLLAAYCSLAPAQVQDRINRGCGGLGGTLVQVLTDASGNIYMITCTGKQVFINGSPIVPGGPTGSGTAGTIPLWTSSTVLGNSLLTQTATSAVNLLTASFNYGGIAAPAVSAGGQGKFYFDSGTNTFKGSYNGGAFLDVARANVTNGTVPLANSTGNTFGNSFLTQSGNDFAATLPGAGTYTSTAPGGYTFNTTAGNVNTTRATATAAGGWDFRGVSGDAGRARLTLGNAISVLGDAAAVGNSTAITVNDNAQTIQVNSGAGQTLIGDTGGVGAVSVINIDDGNSLIDVSALTTSMGKSSGNSKIATDANLGQTVMGDVSSNGNGTRLIVDDGATTFRLNKLVSCTLGVVTDASGILACAVSDGRLKTNFSAYRGGLAAIAKLRPQSYNFRAGTHYDADLRRTGFVAQDVQKAVPEAVLANAAGQLSVDPMALIGTLVNATNELAAQVKSLQAQVTRLKRAARRR